MSELSQASIVAILLTYCAGLNYWLMVEHAIAERTRRVERAWRAVWSEPLDSPRHQRAVRAADKQGWLRTAGRIVERRRFEKHIWPGLN